MGHKPKTKQTTVQPVEPTPHPHARHVQLSHHPDWPLAAILGHFASAANGSIDSVPPGVEVKVTAPNGDWVATLRRMD